MQRPFIRRAQTNLIFSSSSHMTFQLNVIMSTMRRKNYVFTLKLDAHLQHFRSTVIFTIAETFMGRAFWIRVSLQRYSHIWLSPQNLKNGYTCRKRKLGKLQSSTTSSWLFLLQFSAEQMTWYSVCLLNCWIVQSIKMKMTLNKYVWAFVSNWQLGAEACFYLHFLSSF